jgi:hypothetical protein
MFSSQQLSRRKGCITTSLINAIKSKLLIIAQKVSQKKGDCIGDLEFGLEASLTNNSSNKGLNSSTLHQFNLN